MITIRAIPEYVIRLGRLGENERLRVEFDVGPYLAELPGASFTLLNQGPGDAAAYPCAAVELDGSTLYWTITSAELNAVGRGRCELIVTVGNVVAKSIIYDTQVLTALDGGGETPPDWESWQQAFAGLKAGAEAAAQEAEAASEAIQNMRVNATTREPGTGATVGKFVNPETGAVELRFGIPQGEPGVSPEIYVHDIEGGHRVMIIRADGTYVPVDVMDGAKGDPGEDYVLTAQDKEEIAGLVDAPSEIDDTAGEGDTDKTWSADKIAGELANAGTVTDVQVNGVSVLDDGVANVPVAGIGLLGVVKIKANGQGGISMDSSNDIIVSSANANNIKAGTSSNRPIAPSNQHVSTFYGLAKVAGVDLANETVTLGQYTDAAKVAIRKMLGVGDWVKVWDDTTTEAVSLYGVDTDSDGNPFVLRDAIIYIIAAAGTQQNTYLSLLNTARQLIQVSVGNIINTGVVRTVIRCERIADKWNITMNTPSNNYRDIDKTNQQMFCGLIGGGVPNNIAEIRLGATSIPAGTQIMVYGRYA